jgi:hypothetical protein
VVAVSNGTRVTQVPAHVTGNIPTIVVIQRVEAMLGSDEVVEFDSVVGPFADYPEAHRWLDQQIWFDTSPNLRAVITRMLAPGWMSQADAEANVRAVDTMSKRSE